MGILDRFTSIVKANINELLDKAEDPEKMVDQYLREMTESLAEVREATAGVMAEEKRCKKLLDENREETEKYEELARKALAAGNEADARVFLAKKQELAGRAEGLTVAYEGAKANADKMRQMHDKLVADIEELNARKATIKAKAAVAKTQSKVNEMTSAGDRAEGARSAFDRMEAKADEMLDRANAVAELTFSKMLDLSRHTIPANYDVKVNKTWDKYKFVGRELRGKTLGILGFGRIGQRVGELGRAFQMKIVAYDPYLPAHVFEEQQATSMGIDELLKVSDFVTIHMPLTDETKNLFNAKSISEMKDDAVVLNMARGGIVNEQDMYEALKAGKIGGYASDVMENELAAGGLTEGAGFDSPLFECENFLVSPHLGAQSTDASRDIGAHIIAKVKEALNLG